MTERFGDAGFLLHAETCNAPPHPSSALSLLPTFSPKAPLISWNLINGGPFCELVY